MLSYSLINFCIVICVISSVVGKPQAKLKIDIYYESLCPDSREFIVNQLHPTWSEIAPHADLKFIVFGKSESNDDGTAFRCQHGPKECLGNRLQLCALEAISDPKDQVEYVSCFMKLFPSDREQQCEQNLSINHKEIEECANSKPGLFLSLTAEKQTKGLAPRFVPTIVYDGVFNQELQDSSIVDFKGTVCKLVRQNNPSACPDIKLQV